MGRFLPRRACSASSHAQTHAARLCHWLPSHDAQAIHICIPALCQQLPTAHAYPCCVLQGFASGDCDRDAQAIRIFLADGHRMGCSQSYAKNMGLYGQRVGCFSIITDSPKEAVSLWSSMGWVLALGELKARAFGVVPPLQP